MASTWDSSSKVVWKRLGEQFVTNKRKISPSNSGQVIKKYLLSKEKEGEFHFDFKGKNEEPKKIIRKALFKVGEKVSAPLDMSSAKVHKIMKQQVQSGEIEIGVGIVQREYKKLTISKNGELVTKTFTVEGRKHPLINIRKKLFTKYHKYMRLNCDSYFENLDENVLHERLKSIGEFKHDETSEFMRKKLRTIERTRHLQVWHDASMIANHGHILFCVNILYDPAVFYTQQEYKRLHGVDVNIQSQIEIPELYIIGRCKSNDEQLGYINTRVDCLKYLSEGIVLNDLDKSYDKSFVLNDVMRMFHGDGPASQLEAGNQKGGNYFCPSCDIHICQTDDISCSFEKKYSSYSEKQNLILKGVIGKKNSLENQTQPFEKLTVNELIQELKSRNVDISGLKETKKDLNPTLKKHLAGAKRVPILIMNDPLIDLKTLNLEHYEICTIECMHDIAGHIEHVLVQLPNFIRNETQKNDYTQLFNVLNTEKERKRCCDWRRILLVITFQLYHKIDGKVHKLLIGHCVKFKEYYTSMKNFEHQNKFSGCTTPVSSISSY